MGCGATKDSQVGVVDSYSSNSKSNGNYNSRQSGGSNNRLNNAAASNRNLNGKVPLRPINGNAQNGNRNSIGNGFKQVDIKYSNDYYQDNNSNSKKTTNGSTKATPPTNGKPPQPNGKAGPPAAKPNGKNQAAPPPQPQATNKNQPPPGKGGKPPVDNKKQQNVPPPAPVAKPVAFAITFDDDRTNKATIEEILKNKPPKHRFQLEPLKSRPKITQQELDEKMRAVELKREQMLAEKIKPVKQISVRQDLHREKQSYEYEASMDSASKQREAKLEEIKDKQRRQDDKRQRIIKDRRNLANQELDDLRYNEFERDKYYNSHYDDF